MNGIKRIKAGGQARQSCLPFAGVVRAGSSNFLLTPKARLEVGGNHERLIRFLGKLLTDRRWDNDFAAMIGRRLGGKPVGECSLVRVFNDDGYVVGQVALGSSGALALMLPLRDSKMRAMEALVKEERVPNGLRRSGLLAKHYGIYMIELGPGVTVPLFVREYIAGDTLHDLVEKKRLTDRHIFALGEIFGRILALDEQVGMSNLNPSHFIFVETKKGVEVRISNLSEIATNVGPIDYLRRGLSEKIFRDALTRRGLVARFAAGLSAALPKKLPTIMVVGLGAEQERVADEIKGLKARPKYERAAYKDELTQKLLYRRLLQTIAKSI
ncbi:MAG: hypothetical protein MUC35_06135 [Candidatus Margulisbacteria bacterium]|jgi:hypothetical protein|nr:hypothetical protein [Candidatus Margulisiibacteriota bacterium]